MIFCKKFASIWLCVAPFEKSCTMPCIFKVCPAVYLLFIFYGMVVCLHQMKEIYFFNGVAIQSTMVLAKISFYAVGRFMTLSLIQGATNPAQLLATNTRRRKPCTVIGMCLQAHQQQVIASSKKFP